MPKGIGYKEYPKDKKSRAFISRKIRKLLKEGKRRDVAIATALSMARERRKK